jgi:hypothetical protein
LTLTQLDQDVGPALTRHGEVQQDHGIGDIAYFGEETLGFRVRTRLESRRAHQSRERRPDRIIVIHDIDRSTGRHALPTAWFPLGVGNLNANTCPSIWDLDPT